MKVSHIFLFLALIYSSCVHAMPLEEMGTRLIQLRGDLEEAGRELHEVQKQSSAKVEPYIVRKTEVESQIQKEHLRNLQLVEKTKFLRSQVLNSKSDSTKDFSALGKIISKLENQVLESLPFLRAERLISIAELKSKIQKKQDSPLHLANELWSRIESELKLTNNNEYLIGKVSLNNVNQEAEIARLGMVQMVFRTQKGELGHATFSGKTWSLETVRSGSDIAHAIERSLNKFKSKNTSGWFELPGISKLVGEEI